MAFETTCTSLRENLARVLDRVVADNEVAIVRRKGAKDVALLPAKELAGYVETAHLLRPPRSARRLLTALHRAEKRQGKVMSIEELLREIGLEAQG
ncbi:MAG: type II toxin-antitoxin system Phd/YefM family antitoxin [Acidobacteriia bacterium]|nr:type II toxin-antitoxin system Phd/YefM family antitoxin [Terriglobia bacterium]